VTRSVPAVTSSDQAAWPAKLETVKDLAPGPETPI
jgi:hypothetical protein